MRVLLINSVCGIRSTGRICTKIAREYEDQGHEVKIAYGREGYVPAEDRHHAVRIGSDLDLYAHALKARLSDKSGLGSVRATGRFLKWADDYDPDLLWLHNIHGYYIDIVQLFGWIRKRPGMKVRWTLHDCWAFTGHCPHFSYVGCDRWQEGCHDCPQIRRYPKAYRDRSEENYELKKKLFTGIKDLTIVTPSEWLAGLVSKSFLKEYPVEIVRNNIDTKIFHKVPGSFKKEHGLEDKYLILGVASSWDEYKGLSDFYALAERLDEDCQIVLAGLTKKQLKALPSGILGLPRTDDQRKLAELYSSADVFVNLSYEDNYPTVDLEAQACGLPVIAYDSCGNPETLKNNGRNVLVRCHDLDGVAEAIRQVRASAGLAESEDVHQEADEQVGKSISPGRHQIAAQDEEEI